jgi:cytochrome oxidase Cu insertion factor (SCO1/SenC/PrrC family)
MPKRLLLTLFGIGAALVLLTAACGEPQNETGAAGDRTSMENEAGGSGTEARTPKKPTVEHDFTVTTFTGKEFHLAEQRGTPVVVNFWESW